MNTLAKIIFKKLGWGGILILFGILGVVFAVRDSSKNIGPHWSFDFKVDIIVAAAGFIGGAIAVLVRKKRADKARAAAEDAAKEAERRAKSDPKYWNKPKAAPDPAKIPLKSISDAVLSELDSLPMIKLTPVKAETDIYDSKLGGVPYMPKDFPYPTGDSGIYAGKPLRLLAQLNFETLPHIEDFPEKGILQFFCSCDSDEGMYGLELSYPGRQNGFKVIYHENITYDRTALITAADLPEFDRDGDFPFEGEFLLKPSGVKKCHPTAVDLRFGKAFVKAYNKMTGANISSVYDAYEGEFADGTTLEDMFDFIVNYDTCIGGYPDFTQRDPRKENDSTGKCTIMLFQLSSHTEDNIMWGDMGVGNFFISPEDLRNRDFSKVIFNWDCC